MSTLPLQFAVEGYPCTWGPAETLAGTDLNLGLTNVTPGQASLVLGVDGYVFGPLLGRTTIWYELNGIAPVMIHSDTYDPGDLTAHPWTWRGRIGITQGDTLTFHSGCLGPSLMGMMAWGVVLPVRLAGHYG